MKGGVAPKKLMKMANDRITADPLYYEIWFFIMAVVLDSAYYIGTSLSPACREIPMKDLYIEALGRADTFSYQDKLRAFASGICISDQSAKSTAHSAVISTILKSAPARYRSCSR